jgi:hypothetical protein
MPHLRRQLYADLRTASRVTVHAAYFLPSGELGRMLTNVALRGEVRILMPANSDVPVAQLATWHAIRRLGSVAIRFFEYLPQMMHGKLLVIDDVVYVGSANLDVRSRLINYELMLRYPCRRWRSRREGCSKRICDTADRRQWPHQHGGRSCASTGRIGCWRGSIPMLPAASCGCCSSGQPRARVVRAFAAGCDAATLARQLRTFLGETSLAVPS